MMTIKSVTQRDFSKRSIHFLSCMDSIEQLCNKIENDINTLSRQIEEAINEFDELQELEVDITDADHAEEYMNVKMILGGEAIKLQAYQERVELLDDHLGG